MSQGPGDQIFLASGVTVEPVLKDHPIGHKNVVYQDRWSLVTGSVVLKGSFCHKFVVVKTGGLSWQWSLMAVVSQDRFHCIYFKAVEMRPDLEHLLWCLS